MMSEISQVVKNNSHMLIWIVLIATLVLNTIISTKRKNKQEMGEEFLVAFLGAAVMVWLKYELNIAGGDLACFLYIPAHVAGFGYFVVKYPK